MDSASLEVLDHYFRKVVPRRVSLRVPSERCPLLSSMMSLAQTNAAYLQSLLCLAEGTRSVDKTGMCVPSTLSITYRGQAIRRIYEECQKPGGAAAASTVLAIACVMFYDVMYGDIDAVCHHAKGIDDLVAMCGGLHNFELPELINRTVPWLDHTRAVLTNTAPRYDCRPSPYSLNRPQGLQHQTAYHRDIFLTPQLPTLIDSLVQLTALRCESYTRDVSDAELDHFLLQRDFLDHELTRLHSELLGSGTWDSCVVLALLLFSNHELRLMDSQYAIFGHLALELQKALLATDVESFWGSQGCHVLIWVLFMGASIAPSFEDLRYWFVGMLREVLTSLGWTAWEDMEYVLKSVVWAEGFYDTMGIFLEATAV